MPYPELNLARRPYRDFRLFTAVMAVLYAVAIGVTLLSVRGVVRKFTFNESTQERIRELEQGVKDAKAETETLRKTLATVDFGRINTAAQSVNDLIGRRAFAWSRILERLEKILPDDVRVVSLSTTQDGEGRGISVRLTCFTTARDGLLRTVTALDADPQFHDILPGSFSDEAFSSAPGKKFDLAVRFTEEAP
jgi:Tfp pilus assembly protein PilN